MVNSGSLNGGRAAATDLEKGEVWEEDLEEGESYETEEGRDLEKRRGGAVIEISEPSLSEPLLTPEEVEHEGLAAASKRLVPMEKIILSVVVLCFVVVEAYFVGRSFRNWIDANEHLHDDNGTPMNNTEIEPMPLPLELPALFAIDGGGVNKSVASAKPSEVIWEGSLDSGEVTMKEILEEVSPIPKLSTTMAHLPPDVEIDSQMLVLQLMEEEVPISTENDGDGGRR